MSSPDFITKKYFSNKKKFADLFNAILFQGEQRIRAEDLSEGNTEHLLSLRTDQQRTYDLARYRDCMMIWKDEVNLLLLGIENQDKIHYAMPLKNLLYDVMSYSEQVTQIRNQHVQKKEYGNSHEFLSGFHKDDSLKPVLTVVIYWGDDTWNAAMDFQSMIEFSDQALKERLSPYLPQYRILLIEPDKIDQFDMFQTSLRDIFGMMKYRKDVDRFKDYVTDNHRLLDAEDLSLLRYILKDDNFTISQDKEMEAVEVCIATQAIFDEGKLKGRLEGRLEGKSEGRLEGRLEERNLLLEKLELLGVDKELIQKLKSELSTEAM